MRAFLQRLGTAAGQGLYWPQFQHKTTRPTTNAVLSVASGGNGLAVRKLPDKRSAARWGAVGARWPERRGTRHA